MLIRILFRPKIILGMDIALGIFLQCFCVNLSKTEIQCELNKNKNNPPYCLIVLLIQVLFALQI